MGNIRVAGATEVWVTVANSTAPCASARGRADHTHQRAGNVVEAPRKLLKMAKTPKYQDTKVWQRAEEDRQAQALKITRLRALRLSKEAADRDAADRVAAPAPPKRPARQINRSTPLS
jgi:hypothetical protein